MIIKLKLLPFVLFVASTFGFSQGLTFEPYQFISKAGDTVMAEIGSFKVIENRSKSESDSIMLKFIRFKSTNPNPSSAIVYLSGGTGRFWLRDSTRQSISTFYET